MSEETMEELTAKLESLKKANLEREIALEQAKADEASKLEEKKKEDILRETIKTEVLEEMQGESKILTAIPDEEHVEKKTGEWETFRANYMKKHNLTGESYEDMARRMSDGGFKGARK